MQSNVGVSENSPRTPLERALRLLEVDPEARAVVSELLAAQAPPEEVQALQMEIAKQAVALQELQSLTEQQRIELDEVERAHGELLVAVALQSHTILSVCSSHSRGGLVPGVGRETDQR